jgi:hypothetical protein
MLQPYFRNDDTRWAQTWQELGEGVPTLTGFARLCSLALARESQSSPQLSAEAKALLFAAKDFGMIEIKGSNRAFDAPSRLLAAYVEQSSTKTVVFRNREIPEYTIRMLAGFRELCEAGLVMHHIYCDFSLTREGFALARTIEKAEVETILKGSTDLSSAD